MNQFIKYLFLPLILATATMTPMEMPKPSTTQVESNCSLCFQDMDAQNTCRLGCGHAFCADCLRQALHLGLDAEWAQSMAKHLKCSHKTCSYQMNEQDIHAITGDAARVARYQYVLTALFINANRNMRRCPTAGCEAIYEVGFRSEQMTCRACHATYCSDCCQQHNQEISCHEALPASSNNAFENQSTEELQERQYQEWLKKNTKQCPKCKINIQKNGGCKHMTCKNQGCGYEFCWDCSSRWSRDTHPSYFQCPTSNEQPQPNNIHHNQHPAGIFEGVAQLQPINLGEQNHPNRRIQQLENRWRNNMHPQTPRLNTLRATVLQELEETRSRDEALRERLNEEADQNPNPAIREHNNNNQDLEDEDIEGIRIVIIENDSDLESEDIEDMPIVDDAGINFIRQHDPAFA